MDQREKPPVQAKKKNLGGDERFFFLQNVQTGSAVHPTSYSMSTRVLSREKGDVHVYLVPRLRISGGIPLLPLYAFMAWTGTNFTFPDL
jgi:hypothetical protein